MPFLTEEQLSTPVGIHGETLSDIILLTQANKDRLDRAGINPPEEELPADFYDAYMNIDEHVTGGFVIGVYLRNIHLAGKFSSFQFKANFAPGVNFLGASKGDLIERFGFGFQAADGHPKEGLVGGYASSLEAVDGLYDQDPNDAELLARLEFSGPPGAAFSIHLTEFKLSMGSQTLKGNLAHDIMAA